MQLVALTKQLSTYHPVNVTARCYHPASNVTPGGFLYLMLREGPPPFGVIHATPPVS
jgi:hypothetical protein